MRLVARCAKENMSLSKLCMKFLLALCRNHTHGGNARMIRRRTSFLQSSEIFADRYVAVNSGRSGTNACPLCAIQQSMFLWARNLRNSISTNINIIY